MTHTQVGVTVVPVITATNYRRYLRLAAAAAVMVVNVAVQSMGGRKMLVETGNIQVFFVVDIAVSRILNIRYYLHFCQ